MRKMFLLFCVMVTSFLIGTDRVVTPELLKLLDQVHIQHDGTLPTIVKATQAAWLRPAGKERWEIEKRSSDEDRQFVLQYYNETGKLQEKLPSKSHYRASVVFGATVSRMENRFQFFEKMWSQGIRVEKVILLSGARSLDNRAEVAPAGCKTEGDAMVVLWKASSLFSQLAWQQIDHPMIKKSDGAERRPTTIDTIELWMKSDHLEGDYVFITNQPYCCYFDAIARSVLPAGVQFEVVGAGVSPESQTTETLLDNLARWLYMENQIRLQSHAE